MSPEPSDSEEERRRAIFVVHGRNERLRRSLFEFLRSVGLRPIEWTRAVAMTREGSPYVGDVLTRALQAAQAIVVLLTPDDVARLSDDLVDDRTTPEDTELSGQPRPNVLFEAGMAYGWDSSRTILVQIGRLRPISDILGRHVLYLSDSPERRQDLLIRLRTAG